MKRLDKKSARLDFLNLLRKTGNFAAACDRLHWSEQSVRDYLYVHPEFQQEIDQAKKDYAAGCSDSLQELWDQKSEEYTGLFAKNLFALVTDGDCEEEVRTILKPVKANGVVQCNAAGEPETELDKKIIIEIKKGPPRWASDVALQLVKRTFGAPQAVNLAPTLFAAFIGLVKKRGDKLVEPETFQELLELIQEFQKLLRSQKTFLTGRTR